MKKNKYTYFVCGLCFLIIGCVSKSTPVLSESDQSSQADVIIEHVTIIDAVSGEQSDMSVVIKDEKITKVFSSKQKIFIQAKRRVDGKDKFLIPGLWDAHVHLTYDAEVEDSMFRLFLANGITSVRDTGGELDKVLAVRKKSRSTLAPTVYIAGPLIDGDPTVYNGEAKGFPKIADTAATPDEVERLVDNLAAADVDLIKAYEMLSPETFKALLNRAKEHGLPVTGHVPLSMTAKQAAQAGLRSMEHMRNVEMDCSSEEDALFAQRQSLLEQGMHKPGSKLRSEIHGAQHHAAVSSYDAERCSHLLKELAQYDVWQVPTLTLMLASKKPFFIDEEWWETYQYLPEDIANKWREASKNFVPIMQNANPARDKRIEVATWREKMIPMMLEAKVKIMAGTDAPLFYLTPGFSLHKELQTLVNAGMSPMQAIEAATLSPAKYFNLQNTQGSISQGMLADLVLLNANPLDDISHTSDIAAVIKHGQILDRAYLNGLLAAP